MFIKVHLQIVYVCLYVSIERGVLITAQNECLKDNANIKNVVCLHAHESVQ